MYNINFHHRIIESRIRNTMYFRLYSLNYKPKFIFKLKNLDFKLYNSYINFFISRLKKKIRK